MTPIDFGGGMIFPNRYDRDQDDGPDPCDECEGTGIVTGGELELHQPEYPCPVCGGTGQVG